MMRISISFFSLLFLLVLIIPTSGQDTLRTYGPRVGIDMARIVYLFSDPAEIGAEFSVDFEAFNNIFPVFELGYNSIEANNDLFSYSTNGGYARLGIDYNLLPVSDRSTHHSMTVGAKYGISIFNHFAEDITVFNDYWGDLHLERYENNLTGHWIEIVGGVKSEVAPNFFLGWLVRYKLLLNPSMDENVTPRLVPGYGNGTANRAFGFTYSILYKIPLLKK